MKKDNKDLIVYFVSSSVISVFGFILSLLYSKMFSPSDYGDYAIAFSTYNLILNIYCGWITSSIIRCFKEYENKNQITKFYASFFQLQLYMGALFLIIPNMIIWNLNISKIFKQVFCILTVVYFFEENMAIINTMLRAQKRVKQYNMNTVINSALKIVLLLVMYYVLHIDSVMIIALSILLTEVVQYIYSYRKLQLKQYYHRQLYDTNILKEMFKFGFPLVGVALTSWILSTSDRYIIKYFYSSNEVGLYSYAYSLGNSLFKLLIQFIILAAYPNIVRAWEVEGREKTEDVIQYYLRFYFMIIIPAIVGVCCIAKQFFIAYTDVRYHESYMVFILTCISMALVGLSQYTNKAWELNKNTKKILLLNMVAAVINIVLNFILIPVCGYYIAVVTTLISYAIYLCISIIMSKHILTLKINIKSLVKVSVASVVMLLVIVLFKALPISVPLSIKVILEVLIGLVVYAVILMLLGELNKKEIKQLYEEIKNRGRKKV